MIKLYTTPSPNCQKVAIMLEETKLPYETQEIALLEGEQKKPAYTLVNPNARVKGINSKAEVHTPAERHIAMTWARRLKQVFSIDIEVCGRCGYF